MRGLQTSDIIAAARVLTKIGLKEEIKEVARQAEENKNSKNNKNKKDKFDFGFDLIFGVIEKATQKNAEREIYIFIADLLECTPEEVEKMNPAKMLKALLEVANVEEWKDFFGYVRKLILKK